MRHKMIKKTVFCGTKKMRRTPLNFFATRLRKNAPQARLIIQNVPQARFLTES